MFSLSGEVFESPDPISNTGDEYLYQTERYDNSGSLLPTPLYSLPLPVAGVYYVTLKFADIFIGTSIPGARVFNVYLESNLVLVNFDITSEAGYETATDRSFFVTVTDGALNITVESVVNSAKLSAVQVMARPASVPANPSGASASANIFGESGNEKTALPWAVPLIAFAALAAVVVVMVAVRAYMRRKAVAADGTTLPLPISGRYVSLVSDMCVVIFCNCCYCCEYSTAQPLVTTTNPPPLLLRHSVPHLVASLAATSIPARARRCSQAVDGMTWDDSNDIGTAQSGSAAINPLFLDTGSEGDSHDHSQP